MKLENLLSTIELVETEDKMANEVFKQKLENLREYQKETELRKDKVSKTLFPEKIRQIINKITYNGITYGERKDKAIKISLSDCSIIIFYYENCIQIQIDNKILVLGVVPHKFTEIFDWWSNETYRESHMITRTNLLDSENEMMDVIENNIATIYEEIAKRIEQDTLKRRQINMNNLAKLNKPVVEEPKKQTIVITIRIEE